MTDYRLTASPDTCQWGLFDASVPPALTVKPGDRVTIETVTGTPEVLPDPAKFHIPPELAGIHEALTPFGPHILTGPVAVEGAKPGMVLAIHIEEVKLRQDWGFNLIIPKKGTLPHDYDEVIYNNIPLDADTMTATMPWGLKLPVKPFFGVMGLAPPAGWGKMTSVAPESTGGNLDNKELVAGTTLYLPVHTEGGMFSCGDGHGAQGDGEVCITAIETALEGTFVFDLIEEPSFNYPRAETPDSYITMGMDPDLDQCSVKALREMIDWLGAKAGLTHAEAYMLCSLAGDLHVTQTVNVNKGVHMMMPKANFAPKG